MAAIMNLCMKTLGIIPIIPGNSTALHGNTSLYLLIKLFEQYENKLATMAKWDIWSLDWGRHSCTLSFVIISHRIHTYALGMVLQLKMGNVPIYMWLWPISGNGDKRDSGGANLKRFFWSVRHFLWDALTKRVSNCLGETKLLAHPLLTWIPCPSYTHLTPLMTQRRKVQTFWEFIVLSNAEK